MMTRRHMILALLTLSTISGDGIAQNELPKEELEQMIEMMKQSGMPPAQIEQMEEMLQNMSNVQDRRNASQQERERTEFEAAYSGNPEAEVTIGNREYVLTVTRCETMDLGQGIYSIEAKQAPGTDDAELGIEARGPQFLDQIWFNSEDFSADPQPGDMQFDGDRFEWEGTVNGLGEGDTPIRISLSCKGVGS